MAEIQNKYKKLDHREHVLSRPGMYVGSIESDVYTTWVYDETENKMIKKDINIVPALYKIFDEILVNVIDHYTRLKIAENPHQLKNIKVTIDKESGIVSVFNDGEGIEVVEHPEHKIYIPELIFGNLLTSANYDDTEERIIGGQNGIGAKACNIFSKKFTVETVDSIRKKIYHQEFSDNMKSKTKPVIKACAKKPYTIITFLPDYERLKMTTMTTDMYQLFVKRTYDICALTGPDVHVWLNGVKIEFKTFERYTDLYLGNKVDHPRIYENINERWDIVASYTDTLGFEQVSFVNGIWTIKGGKHVDYITNQICSKLSDMIKKKRKIDVKPQNIKNYLMVFVKSVISNPTFDSQSKDMLTSPMSKFGSKAEIPDKFIEKLYKTQLVDKSLSLCEIQDSNHLKKTDGKKQSTLRGIIKLDDATLAGTGKSEECILILCEGDSAKSMALAGLEVIGRERYGVFPLKGKLMNVKDVTMKKLSENEEITNLKKILGLESNKTYADVKSLRYGKVMMMCDSDYDGSHIKGLLFNIFQTLWPSLFTKSNFLCSMLTPVIKARNSKSNEVIPFYNVNDYEIWKESHASNNWSIKYYKGLGTSTDKEAKEYFKELKIVNYIYDADSSVQCMDLAFNKKRADDRKEWLSHYDRRGILDYADPNVTYEDFVNKDLIHFSNYDIERSIPNICDGLKVSQRKILYSCFKKNLTSEIRVAQLSGYVSENACYHHGEASLQNAIIGLAQDFVGANNINLLMPNGQFGGRNHGGKDASSPRYIHTQINDITFKLFRKEDLNILNYEDDDGIPIEPTFYVPIIPMILVNGAIGIGTGFSTNIPSYNPKDIVRVLREKLVLDVQDNDSVQVNVNQLTPWFKDFKGKVEITGKGKYVSRGCFERFGPTSIRITELPIGLWTEDFKIYLEEMLDKHPEVKSYQIINAIHIDIVITFSSSMVADEYMSIESGNTYTKFENEFKMVSIKNLSNNNMYLFNEKRQITKYDTVSDIIDEFYNVRIEFYEKRRVYWLDVWNKQRIILQNKQRFIREIIDHELVIAKKKKIDIVLELGERNYVRDSDNDYDYLLSMPMYSMTDEKLIDIQNSIDQIVNKINAMTEKTSKGLWIDDLDEFEKDYDKAQKTQEQESSGGGGRGGGSGRGGARGRGRGRGS